MMASVVEPPTVLSRKTAKLLLSEPLVLAFEVLLKGLRRAPTINP
jgi:hypothetical protein